jgi:hypothetical protein
MCSHNETLSIVAMRVCNPDRSTVGIKNRHAAPTPTGFAEIVCDDLPILYGHGCCLLIIVRNLRRRFVRFKLGAHLLQARSKRFDLLLQLLDFVMHS